MAAKTNAREEAVRQAREDASVVLAKHPCVTVGGCGCGESEPSPIDLRPESDQRSLSREGDDLGGGQHGAGPASSP